MDKLQLAKDVMISAHEGQFRKDGITPYSIHPETVVKTLKLLGVTDSDILCAGYLHDVLEDTKYTIEEIQGNFGNNVLIIVKELTFKDDITNEGYWQGCQSMSNDAKWVKVADILTNLGDKGKKSSHFVTKRVQALKILLCDLELTSSV